MALELTAPTATQVADMVKYGMTGAVNVKWFGAVGNGVADDTAAIQAAVDNTSFTMVTTAQTLSSSATLTFGANLTAARRALIENALYYATVVNVTDGATIAAGRKIQSTTSTTVVIDGNVSGTVEVGDVIRIVFYAKGTIFFPPGRYKVTAPITFDHGGPNHSIIFQGVGSASQIFGDFANFIFNRLVFNPEEGIVVFRDLKISNANGNSAAGGIQLRGVVGTSLVENCHIIGFTGLCLSNGNSWQVSNCKLSAATQVGSVGIKTSNGATLLNNDIVGYDIGITHCNLGLQVIGGRIEVCRTGILLGQKEDGTSFNSSGFLLAGVSMESNFTGIEVREASNGVISGMAVTGNNLAAPTPTGPPDQTRHAGYGIRLNTGNGIVVAGCVVSGLFTGIGYDAGSGWNNTFISCAIGISGGGATEWVFPPISAKVTTIQCTNATTEIKPTCTVANLQTASAWRGREFIVTDATTTVASTTAAVQGGGSNIVVVRSRNDAGTWKWCII